MSALVGIQMGAISLADEGVPEVLDIVQNDAGVNAIFVSTQAFDRGVQGRQVDWRPWPGHGHKEREDHHGGSYVTQHAEYYDGTILKPYRAPDKELVGFDVLERILPAARERDIAVYSFVLENTHSGLTRAVPNWPSVLQTDAWGRSDSYACLRNPDYIAWWLAIVEDQVRSYEVDGIMFGSERNGPLGNVLGDGGFARDGQAYCFCRYCTAAGAARGIDPRRAQEGYRKLYELARADDPAADTDSSFIRFLRLILQYPEIVAWDQLFQDGYEDLQKRLYGAIKFLNPELQVGWHIWHHNSFSPLYRAQLDFTAIAEFSDFIKPVIYSDVAGYRLHNHIKMVANSIFSGVSEQTLYDLYRGVLGYDEAGSFDELPARGFSSNYVEREARRTVTAVAGKARVYPGLDVDVAAPDHVRRTTPEGIQASIAAAMAGGSDGYILSRKYSEMSVENLRAAGVAARKLTDR
ncbi:MAG TPA: hypothetical protein VHZ81_10375 [Galbitalea sp.]|jgi:hypothetical protein|nr:hypothetical protein [Galbitalea sp.]